MKRCCNALAMEASAAQHVHRRSAESALRPQLHGPGCMKLSARALADQRSCCLTCHAQKPKVPETLSARVA